MARLWGHRWGWKSWLWLHPRETCHPTQAGCRAQGLAHPTRGGEQGTGRGAGGHGRGATYLVFLGALGQLPELGVQLREAPRDLLDACVQVAVLAVFCIEVVLVALALLRGGNGSIFSEETEKRGPAGLRGLRGERLECPWLHAWPHRAPTSGATARLQEEPGPGTGCVAQDDPRPRGSPPEAQLQRRAEGRVGRRR